MISINLISILDSMTILWLVCLFILLFVVIPSLPNFRSPLLEWEEKLLSSLAKATLITSIGILFLVSVKLLFWSTLATWYLLWCFIGWAWGQWGVRLAQIKRLIQKGLLLAIDALDHGIPVRRLFRIFRQQLRIRQRIILRIQDNENGGDEDNPVAATIAYPFHWLFGIAIVSFAILLRWEYPVQSLRFAYPETYQTLAATRQLLNGDWTFAGSLPIFPAVAAAVSLLGSINAMQVVRFLPALIGVLVPLAMGYCLWRNTQNKVTPLIGMYAIGAYLFTWTDKLPALFPEPWQTVLTTIVEQGNQFLVRQSIGSSLDLAVLFVLIACGQLAALKSKDQRFAMGVNFGICAVLILMTAPNFLGLLLIYGIGRLFGLEVAIWSLTLGWLMLGGFAALPNTVVSPDFLKTLPIPLSLFLALGVSWVLTIGQWFLGKLAQPMILTFLIVVSLKFCLPGPPTTHQYLEYDMVARKTLEISDRFPAKRWLMVAPSEQGAQIYGVGFYEDLAEFVAKYSGKTGDPNFNFPIEIPDIFILVEKRPFITFKTQTTFLPDSFAFDKNYQNYRSTAGRAALQFYALQLCEDYRRSHSDLTIDFEDADFRIYHLKKTVKS
jgi:hypothetical protein